MGGLSSSPCKTTTVGASAHTRGTLEVELPQESQRTATTSHLAPGPTRLRTPISNMLGINDFHSHRQCTKRPLKAVPPVLTRAGLHGASLLVRTTRGLDRASGRLIDVHEGCSPLDDNGLTWYAAGDSNPEPAD